MCTLTFLISDSTIILRKISEIFPVGLHIIFMIDIFYPSGEPISPHLLRFGGFTVEYHSFTHQTLQLQQSRLVNSSGWCGSIVEL